MHLLFSFFAMTQSRITNIPLYLLFQVLHSMLGKLSLDAVELGVSSLVLQHASFFAMGGNNAISGVDLSNAYNGVSGFNIVLVAVMTFVSNWAAPVWWTSSSNLLLLQRERTGQQSAPPASAGKAAGNTIDKRAAGTYTQQAALLTVFAAGALVAVMAACTALRTHLFIWTVFSPKYLYSMAWSLGQHLAVNVAAGGLLYRLGRGGRAS